MNAIARAQRARLNRRQLLQAGVSSDMVGHLLRRGRLQRIHAGVYGVAPVIEVPWGRETAALLAFRPGAGLHGASALAVWGVIPARAGEVHVVVAGERTGRRRGIVAHHSTTLRPRDLTVRLGLPVTKPARAMVDYGDHCTRREMEEALDEALYRKLVSRTKLFEAIRLGGDTRPGARALLAMVQARGPGGVTRSKGERRLRELIAATDVPHPHRNDPLLGFTADFHWREAAYVVEFDGYDAHTTLSTFRRDRRKNRVLEDHGIRVDRFTWEDVTTDALKTIAHISATVALRTAKRATGAPGATAAPQGQQAA